MLEFSSSEWSIFEDESNFFLILIGFSNFRRKILLLEMAKRVNSRQNRI